MNNALGEFTGHLPQEFYACYADTLINIAAETKTNKIVADTLGPLDTITMRGKIMNIFEDKINRILNGQEYITPTFVGLFKGKQHTLTSEF